MGNREIFDAWITKWALTRGIYKIEVKNCFSIDSNMVSYQSGNEEKDVIY